MRHGRREGAQHEASSLVTVVIPCYNQAHFLGEAIERVGLERGVQHPSFSAPFGKGIRQRI